MLLIILLSWCFGLFCREVSTGVNEYTIEKHREEIIEDLQLDIRKNLYEICHNGKTIGYYYKGVYGNCYVPII